MGVGDGGELECKRAAEGQQTKEGRKQAIGLMTNVDVFVVNFRVYCRSLYLWGNGKWDYFIKYIKKKIQMRNRK